MKRLAATEPTPLRTFVMQAIQRARRLHIAYTIISVPDLQRIYEALTEGENS
jgi:hypothetical protein